jgi:hypothetical protein
METGKTSKYLKYAIGEIILVVIGILIALQINNWNEGRKLKTVELNLLKELNNVLEGGKLEGELGFQKLQIDGNKKSQASCEYLLKHFEANLPDNDSLKIHFATAHTRYIGLVRDQAYQNAKSYGFGFIKNDTLKEELIRAYETNTKWLLELNDRNNLYENQTVIPLLTQHFESVFMVDIEEEKWMVPHNYEALKSNPLYRNILKTTLLKRKEYLEYEEVRYQRLLKVHELLNKEIESKSH